MKVIDKIIKDTLRQVLTEVKWRGYEDFDSYQKEDDMELTEFTKVKKEEVSLPVDVFVDDYYSYKRHRHPLWLYFRNSYGEDNAYLPLLISNRPIIPLKNYRLNITLEDFVKVKEFVVTHLHLLIDYANAKIDVRDFFQKIKSIKENKYRINEMATMRPDVTGLPRAIWVDEDKTYLRGGHGPRIKFQAKNDTRQTKSWAVISIEEDPQIIYLPKNPDISNKEINMIVSFVRENYILLKLLCDKKIDYHTDFLENFVKVDKHGKPILDLENEQELL